MTKIHEPTGPGAPRKLWGKPQVIGRPGILSAILLVALLGSLRPAWSAALPSAYSVNLAWDRSPDAEVTGYRIYYGSASGDYTNSVVVGNVATNSVGGLTAGVTYFFTTTALNASGLESPASNEVDFTPGTLTVKLRILANRQAAVSVQGLIGHTYEVLASQNLSTWSVIGSVTLGATATTNFTDTGAANYPQRFYRTRDTTP